MIKLEYIPKPLELTEEMQVQLTDIFIEDKTKTVWNKPFIRKALLNESKNKCAYCECFVGEGYKEMHVDHFHCKDKYPQEVVAWENLVPSCPHCNKSKSMHDTRIKPIINPFLQNPQEYFYIKHYRYYSRNDSVDDIARETIGVLGLNDTANIVKLRFDMGQELSEEIQRIYELARDNSNMLWNDTRKRNRVLNGCKNILEHGVKNAEYSAFMATIIQTDDDFKRLRCLLKELNLWNEDLEKLDVESKTIVLETKAD